VQQQQQQQQQQQKNQGQQLSEPKGCAPVFSFLTCFMLDEPQSPIAPTLSRPLPDPRFVKWTDKLRQQRMQRSLSSGYGASPTVVARDASFLVNVGCDRQQTEQVASWQPQAYHPGPDTFRRLLSAQARGEGQAVLHRLMCRLLYSVACRMQNGSGNDRRLSSAAAAAEGTHLIAKGCVCPQ
jgi:hypothetical protein